MFYRYFSWITTSLTILLLSTSAGAQIIDNFSYAGGVNITSVWRSGLGTQPAKQQAGGGMNLPVAFYDGKDRAYWDRDLDLDLSKASSIVFDLYCDKPEAMRSFAIYFRSGNGWYVHNKPLLTAGRQKLVLRKNDFTAEGSPAGWDQINRIRISPWKGQSTQAQLIIYNLSLRSDFLYLVQATISAPNAAERSTARRTTQRLSRWLTAGGLSHATVTEDSLGAACQSARTIILPYNPRVTPMGLAALRKFVNRGGKLIVFYSSDDNLAKLMQVKLGDIIGTRDIARLRSIEFTGSAPFGVPLSVHQQSWNIGAAKPADKNGRVIAWWANASGERSQDAAVIATPVGYWFTHILLSDDNLAKQRMLIGLLASLDASIWRDAAEHSLLNAGRIDGWKSAVEAVRALEAQAVGHPNEDTILAFTKRISAKQSRMQGLFAGGKFKEANQEGYTLTDALIKAYSLAQKSSDKEMCAVWDHDGTGWYPGDWDKTAKLLSESGINTIFVNATWAGLSHYKSDILPESFTYRYYKDQLEPCIKAARKYGLEVHAWIVCWYLENSPKEYSNPFRGTKRLQQNADRKERLWMNPAHPANVKHHLSVIEEILNRYDVDGIHLDYIRYPDSDSCYSEYSRSAFQAASGVTVANWPRDVQPGGINRAAFIKWRAGNITDFVRQARKRTREIKPSVKLSAAVWGGYPSVVDSIGQDWLTWLQKDYVDFVCPMNYANDLYSFTSLVDQQLALPGARGKIIPGIGVTASESQLRGDQVIEQILALRKRGVGGFALFDLSQTLVDDTLPAIRMGVTKPVIK